MSFPCFITLTKIPLKLLWKFIAGISGLACLALLILAFATATGSGRPVFLYNLFSDSELGR